MKMNVVATCLATLLALPFGVALARDAQTLLSDRETSVGGIPVACAGVGDEANDDPRWPAYSTRIEFANSRAEYLSDVDISIANANGVTLLSVRCESPWFLAKLTPGRYTVTAVFDGRLTKTVKFSAAAHGQARTIVRFPEVGALQ